MNLWIRSQDKSGLIEVDNLYATEGRIVLIARLGGRVTIGKYSSQKRALEVLDEIDNVKWWKYMAELNFENFAKTLNLKYSEEEQKAIFQMMNTYEMPVE